MNMTVGPIIFIINDILIYFKHLGPREDDISRRLFGCWRCWKTRCTQLGQPSLQLVDYLTEIAISNIRAGFKLSYLLKSFIKKGN